LSAETDISIQRDIQIIVIVLDEGIKIVYNLVYFLIKKMLTYKSMVVNGIVA